MDSYLINKVPKETLVQLEDFSAYLRDHRKSKTSYESVIKTINILKVWIHSDLSRHFTLRPDSLVKIFHSSENKTLYSFHVV